MFDRKNDVAKRPSKKPCHASSKSCTSSVVSSPNVWADLLDCLLHQIIALLSSSNDIIAFAATCRSWRAAFTSFPSTLSCNVPPLCLQSHIHYPHRGHSRIKYSLLYNCEWQLTDPVKRSSSCRLSPPHNHPNRMHYLGCSYGNLIFSNSNQCLLVFLVLLPWGLPNWNRQASMRSTTESLMVPSGHPTHISSFAQGHPFSSGKLGLTLGWSILWISQASFQSCFLKVRCLPRITWMGSTPFAWHLN